MNDIIIYSKETDYEIIDSINYEVLNAVDYEALHSQFAKQQELKKQEIKQKKIKEGNEQENKNTSDNYWAISSMILGILSIITILLACCKFEIFIIIAFFAGIASLAGIIVAVIALKKGENKTMAIIGIITAIIGLLFGIICSFFYLFVILMALESQA